ncbi:hypothetical protein LWI28_020400 [Acer negundo]|uniref:Uncharacterized protein n=1 Tax=Acer negundo TaxID=4023 RepID=A0AAD5J608_ACENE|nr:hypothetical protein LWI28_020400 [Acer negundo]
MMSRQNLVIDAWMREAQEAVKLVEDIETRVKSKNNIVEVATKSKLLEVGVKLDRLESLLHKSQPPFKTHFVLHNVDREHRWKMLSDTKLRTKALVLSLYAMPSLNRGVSCCRHKRNQ